MNLTQICAQLTRKMTMDRSPCRRCCRRRWSFFFSLNKCSPAQRMYTMCERSQSTHIIEHRPSVAFPRHFPPSLCARLLSSRCVQFHGSFRLSIVIAKGQCELRDSDPKSDALRSYNVVRNSNNNINSHSPTVAAVYRRKIGALTLRIYVLREGHDIHTTAG